MVAAGWLCIHPLPAAAQGDPKGVFEPGHPARRQIRDRVVRQQFEFDRLPITGGNDCEVDPTGKTHPVTISSSAPLLVARGGVHLGQTPNLRLELPGGCVELTVTQGEGPPKFLRVTTSGLDASRHEVHIASKVVLPARRSGRSCSSTWFDEAWTAFAEGDPHPALRQNGPGRCVSHTVESLVLRAYLHGLSGDDEYCRGLMARVLLLDPGLTLPDGAPASVRRCFDSAERRYPASAMRLEVKMNRDDDEVREFELRLYDPYDLAAEARVYFRGSPNSRWAQLAFRRGDRRAYTLSVPKLATGHLEYYVELVGEHGVVANLATAEAPVMVD